MGRTISGLETALGAKQKTSIGLVMRRLVLFCGLGAMLAVPLTVLDDGRPAPLGWHMYAAAVELPEIEVVMSDGSRERRSIGNIAAGFRPEIDYFEPVARFVCAEERDAKAVHLTRQRPAREEVFECGKF